MKIFTFVDENTNITHCLELLGPEKLLNEMTKDENDEFYINILTAINMKGVESTYGVHDISYSDNALFGFTTYEVKAYKWNELMKIWREILTGLGLRVGKYYKK